MFLQREKELEALNNSFNKANSSIDFIFGPKNSGKTALLHEHIKEKEKIYFSNYEMIPTQFFTKMGNTLNKFFNQANISGNPFTCFLDVLKLLNRQNIEKKLVIILDEFQNILKVDKNALTDLIKFWKKDLKNKNIQMLVSSSTLFSESYLNDLLRVSNEIIHLKYLNFIAMSRLQIPPS